MAGVCPLKGQHQEPPTVVLNDTGSPLEADSTVDPQKPNLTQRFLRIARIRRKQTKLRSETQLQSGSQINNAASWI